MKKTFNILLALLLATAMLFTVTACGNANGDDADAKVEKAPEELIIGEWEGTVEFGDYMSELLATSLDAGDEDYFDNLTFDMVFDFEFTKDGEATLTINKSEFEKSLDSMKDDLKEGLAQMLKDMAEENDADLDDLVAGSGYDSLDELIDDALSELTAEDMLDSFGGGDMLSGTYEIDGDKLYILDEGEERGDDNCLSFEISEKKLTINLSDEAKAELDEDEEIVSSMFPMELNRK